MDSMAIYSSVIGSMAMDSIDSMDSIVIDYMITLYSIAAIETMATMYSMAMDSMTMEGMAICSRAIDIMAMDSIVQMDIKGPQWLIAIAIVL